MLPVAPSTRHGATSQAVGAAPLTQTGALRGTQAAEDRLRAGETDEQRFRASMRPRHSCAEDPGEMCLRHSLVSVASMRPRHKCRGRLKDDGAATQFDKLQ